MRIAKDPLNDQIKASLLHIAVILPARAWLMAREGAVLELEEGIFRISQDCSNSYGREIHLFKINKLTPTVYEEELVMENWFKTVLRYQHSGHHLTVFKWNEAWYWAVDLNYPDTYFQLFLKYSYS